MSANKTVLEVLAREGVLVTEQEVTRATRNKQQSNGVVPVQVKNAAESNGAAEFPIPTRRLGPSNRMSQGPQPGRIVNGLREVWLFPFKALREAYWLIDPDAKCRSVGLQTVGRIDKKESEEHTDPETGSTSYTYYVRYAYQVDGRSHTARKRVGGLGNLLKGAAIRVYYLPHTDPTDWREPKSAIDFEPLALAEREVKSLEASPERAERGYARITNGSEPR